MLNLYVGNLPYSVTDQELNEIFSEIGEVQSARVMNDRETGRSRGFGFVEMKNEEEGREAIEKLSEAARRIASGDYRLGAVEGKAFDLYERLGRRLRGAGPRRIRRGYQTSVLSGRDTQGGADLT